MALRITIANGKRILAAFAVFGFCLGDTLSAQTVHTTVRHHKVAEADSSFPPELIKAEEAIEKKDYATAEPLLEKVVAANDANYQAWFDLGFVRNAVGKADESIAAYRKSVAAKPDVFESNLNLGLMLARAGKLDAEQFLRAATKLKPTAHVEQGQARAWLSLAQVVENTKPDEAITAYQEVARLQPKDPEPHLYAGQLLEKQGNLDGAEQNYKQALALDAKSADALTGLVNVYTRGKRYSEAEDLLRRLAQLRPEDTVARVQLGRVLAAGGKKDEAIVELEAVAKQAPNDLTVQRDLADLYAETGKNDLAEARYRTLLSGGSKDPELFYALGKALLLQRKFPEAQQAFLAAVKLKPDFGAAYGDLGVAAMENKDYPLAIQATDARAKYLPEIPMSYFLRATSYDHLRDFQHASENYHRFLEVANGKYPDQEWQARHRLIAIEPKKR